MKSTGDELIVYSHAKEASAGATDVQADASASASAVEATDSTALTKWQALEDAPAAVDTIAIADHGTDAQAHHTTDGWLL